MLPRAQQVQTESSLEESSLNPGFWFKFSQIYTYKNITKYIRIQIIMRENQQEQ